MNQLKKTSLGFAILVAIFVVGCDSNPTNEPSANDIAKANKARADAIDKDPSLTPEGKAKMKEMLHLNGQSTNDSAGRKK